MNVHATSPCLRLESMNYSSDCDIICAHLKVGKDSIILNHSLILRLFPFKIYFLTGNLQVSLAEVNSLITVTLLLHVNICFLFINRLFKDPKVAGLCPHD